MIRYFWKVGMRKELLWFPGVLSGGNPKLLCSYCRARISGDRNAVRIIDVDSQAWLHARCFVHVVGQRKDDEYANNESDLRTRDASAALAGVPGVGAAGVDPGMDGWTAPQVGPA